MFVGFEKTGSATSTLALSGAVGSVISSAVDDVADEAVVVAEVGTVDGASGVVELTCPLSPPHAVATSSVAKLAVSRPNRLDRPNRGDRRPRHREYEVFMSAFRLLHRIALRGWDCIARPLVCNRHLKRT